MDFNLFKSTIDQTHRKTDYLRLHEMGEPLIDKNIFKFIDYCSEKGIKTEISTNATILSEDAAEKILNSKLDNIILCLDGFTRDVYEKVRSKADFEKTKENIARFLELKNNLKKRLKVYLQIISMKETEKQISDFIEYWKRYKIDKIIIKKFSTFSNQVESISSLAELKHRYKNKIIKKRPPCYYLWDSVVVLYDGSVVPCCRDYDASYILGNVKNESLNNIWNGKKIKQLRRMHIDGNFNVPLCRDCLEWPEEPYTRLYPLNKDTIMKFFKQFKKTRDG